MIACEGESLRYGPNGVRQAEHTRRAAEVLGLFESRQLGFPDQRLDTLSLLDLIAPLERAVREVRPTVVYCQFGSDANRDHELLFRAALVATRPLESCIEGASAWSRSTMRPPPRLLPSWSTAPRSRYAPARRRVRTGACAPVRRPYTRVRVRRRPPLVSAPASHSSVARIPSTSEVRGRQPISRPALSASRALQRISPGRAGA